MHTATAWLTPSGFISGLLYGGANTNCLNFRGKESILFDVPSVSHVAYMELSFVRISGSIVRGQNLRVNPMSTPVMMMKDLVQVKGHVRTDRKYNERWENYLRG